jgi:hypothetical protein
MSMQRKDEIMISTIAQFCRHHGLAVALGLGLALACGSASAQIQSVDPDTAIDGDLVPPSEQDVTVEPARPVLDPPPADQAPVAAASQPSTAASQASTRPAVAVAQDGTYKEDDLIGAAEGVFGKGAEGVARMIEDILAKQGEPNAYIVGREGGGAFVLGVRYGSGTLYHKVEGKMPVYWTGPSIGFDVGANAGNTFVLVYNLYDTDQLYERYPAGEGDAYFIGGLTASYLRKGDVVLIPIRVGAGLRLGVNAGYMKFSKEQKWLPF